MDKTPNDLDASVKGGGDQSHSSKSPFDPKDEPNLYQILNLEPHANRLQIREAYIKLKSAYEQGSAALYSLIPDDEAKIQLGEIELAYHCLSDDVSRRTYDLKLGLDRTGQAPSSARPQHAHQISSPRMDSRTPSNSNTERLVYAQETLRAERLASFGTRDPDRNFGASIHHYGGANGPDYGLGTIQTNRSTLPVVKLKAENSDNEAVNQQMQELLATSDLGDGELYKKLREIAGVGQDEMQDRTKISVGYLLALESNRLDRLPQAVYVKGFLRSYFRYINAPQAEAMVDAFALRLSQWQTKHRS